MGYQIEQNLIHVNSHTRPGTKLKGVKGVVIHWTANEAAGADADAHFRYFDKGLVYASAHFFVDSGKILRIIPENEVAYHVGAKSYKTTKYGTYPNATMIGVEMCVNAGANFQETWKRSVWLVADLLKRHGLSINELERHFDITGKSCPKFFTEDYYAQKYLGMSASAAHAKFVKEVAAILNPPAPAPAPTGTDIGTLEILAGGLNVRESASFSAKIEGVATKGQKFTVHAEKNGMYHISGNKLNGWCSAGTQYVKFTAKPKPAPKPAAPAPVSKAKSYTVVKGDTLWGISRKTGVSVENIKKINGLRNDLINPGDVLYLAKVHVVQKGDTLWGIATKNKLSVAQLKKLNGLKSDTINPGDVLTLA
jgi:N-acetylmuramoyl-L-alanine amidase